MSSAANHAARSHRSQRLKRSAFGSMSRKARLYEAGRTQGGAGVPLIMRLQAMRQKILESRKKPAEDASAG